MAPKEVSSDVPTTETLDVDVVIVGAGASGLQASQCLCEAFRSEDDGLRTRRTVLVLEARDRIGGRVCSTKRTVSTVDGRPVQVVHDEGAAWVHGIGYDWPDLQNAESSDVPQTRSQPHVPGRVHVAENPIVPLLALQCGGLDRKHLLFRQQKESPAEDPHRDLPRLVPVFRHGNPWMRPKSCLVDQNQLAVYYNGKRMDDCINDSDGNNRDHAYTVDEGASQPTTTDTVVDKRRRQNAKLIKQSLRRHWQILDEVDDIGRELQEKQRHAVCIEQSLHSTLHRVQQKRWFREYRRKIIASMSISKSDYDFMECMIRFYLHLAELWYAGSTQSMQLSEFTVDTTDHSSVDLDQYPWDTAYSGEGDYYGPHCTVTTGMISALQPLLGHGEDLRLGQAVASIRYVAGDDSDNGPIASSSRILVTTEQGLVVRARACIVTIPLACLKDTVDGSQDKKATLFDPPLSSSKQEAIRKLRVGSYKKVVLTFDRIFWAKEPAFVALLAPSEAPCGHDGASGGTNENGSSQQESDATWESPLGDHLILDNLWAKDGIPMAEVVLTSSAAEWAHEKPSEMIQSSVLQFMQRAMGIDTSLSDWCVDCHITRWEEDPFSKGAYSTFGIGCSSMTHSTALRSPEWNGSLVFGGEHTVSEFEGSVYAALASGRNASASVLEYLRGSGTSRLGQH